MTHRMEQCHKYNCPDNLTVCCRDCNVGNVLNCQYACKENPRKCEYSDTAYRKASENKIIKIITVVAIAVIVTTVVCFSIIMSL